MSKIYLMFVFAQNMAVAEHCFTGFKGKILLVCFCLDIFVSGPKLGEGP